jgi:predicted ATPase/DNA-binding CsgD family transcriptional regulator
MFEHRVLQLPPQLTSFVGRADEIIQIAQQLDIPDCRLLTLVGPGGIGKTRLAIEVARHMSNRYVHGVYFVDLQPVSAVDMLVTTLANSIDMRFFGEQPPRIQLLNFLHDRNLLLLIDNFEHLLDGVDLLTEIVKTAPKVKLLVTSREALNIQEEWLWQVQGLQVPENEHVGSIENFSAVRLFSERAHSVRSDFVLDKQKIPVIRICHLVEGMPLALELAASWTKALSCSEIANEIQRGLDFLSANRRNLPERHRSMQAVFDQSWRMLMDEESMAFPKLSVFRGGFRREAAEAVAGASLTTLAGLVDKSFLRVSSAGRYEIHELMRQYGEEQLDAEEKEIIQNRHCSYYANFLHKREPKLKGQDQIVALDEIGEELDNLQASWEWAVEKRKRIEIEQSGYSVLLFYHIRSKSIEGELAFELAVKRFGDEESALSAYLILAQAWCASYNGKLTNPETIQIAIRLFHRFRLQEGMAFPLAIVCLGSRRICYDNREELFEFFLQTLAYFRERNELWGIGWIFYSLGNYARYYKKFDEAESYYQKSIESFKAVADSWALTMPMGALALVFKDVKQYDKALQALQGHESICQELGDSGGVIWSLSIQAQIAIELQDFEGARRSVIRGLETVIESATNFHALVDLLYTLVYLLVKRHTVDWAVELLGFLHGNAQKLGADLFLPKLEEELNMLVSQIPIETFQKAIEAGKTLNLKTVLTQLQAELSTQIPLANASKLLQQPLHDPLTERELEVLRLIANGLQNQEIADQLFIVIGTVKAHINAIYRKLDVANRVQAISRAHELKLL